jgi:hypothetical protein
MALWVKTADFWDTFSEFAHLREAELIGNGEKWR